MTRATTGTFQSLRNRNFRLFFIGQLVSQTGNWLTLVAQTLLVLELTDSGVALGVLTATQFGPVLLLGPWAGLVADRSDKRRLLLSVQVLAMGQSMALAALAATGDPSVYAVYAVSLAGGLTTAFDNPTRRSFVSEMVTEDEVTNAVSLNSALLTGARIVGPALAGLLVGTVGYAWTFAGDGVSYVAVIVALAMMRPSELLAAPVTPRGRGQMRAGFRYARSIPELWAPLTMMAIVGVFAFNFQVVFPLFATRDLGGDDGTFTMILTLTAVGSLAGALRAARRTDVDVATVARAALLFAAGMAFMAVAPNVGVVVVAALVLGYVNIVFVTTSTAIVQLRATPEMRGRVVALQSVVFLGSMPVGGPVVGAVSEALGARAGIALGALGCLGAGTWGLAVARRVAERSDDAEPQLGSAIASGRRSDTTRSAIRHRPSEPRTTTSE